MQRAEGKNVAPEALASEKMTEEVLNSLAAVAHAGPEEGDATPETTTTILEEVRRLKWDLEMTISWVGGVEEVVDLETEGVGPVVEAEAWDASEMDLLLVEARQTSENPLTRKEHKDQGYS